MEEWGVCGWEITMQCAAENQLFINSSLHTCQQYWYNKCIWWFQWQLHEHWNRSSLDNYCPMPDAPAGRANQVYVDDRLQCHQISSRMYSTDITAHLIGNNRYMNKFFEQFCGLHDNRHSLCRPILAIPYRDLTQQSVVIMFALIDDHCNWNIQVTQGLTQQL